MLNSLIMEIKTREKRFAVLRNGRLDRLYIEQPQQESLVGNVYLATVEKVLPGMNAAFVDLGEEKRGYLVREKIPAYVLDQRMPADKAGRSISHYVHQGEKLIVQVEKDASGQKGPRVTAIVEVSGEGLVYMPAGRYIAVSKKIEDAVVKRRLREEADSLKKEEEGLIIRTSAAGAEEGWLAAQLEQLRAQYQNWAVRAKQMKKPGLLHSRDFFYEEAVAEMVKSEIGEVIADGIEARNELEAHGAVDFTFKLHPGKEGAFAQYGAEKEIEKLLKRVVWLDKGAYLVFDEGEALTSIDVNTGKFSGKTNIRETVLAANRIAAEEIARQVKLRDIGGMILVDFIDMKEERDRQSIVQVLGRALADDRRRTKIVGFTELGILQLTRKKTRKTLRESLTEPCRACGGSGRTLSSETLAFRLERELWEYRGQDAALIEASADVEAVFCGQGKAHLQRLEEALGMKIFFTPSGSEKPGYSILQFGPESEIRSKAQSVE